MPGPRRHFRATIRQLGKSLWHSRGIFTEDGEVVAEWDYWSFKYRNAYWPMERLVPSAFSGRWMEFTGEWPRLLTTVDCRLRHNAKDYVQR